MPIPTLLVELAMLYLVFAGFALTGALIRPLDLYTEVALPASSLADEASDAMTLQRDRKAVLDGLFLGKIKPSI